MDVSFPILLCLFLRIVDGDDRELSVMEGDSVILRTGLKTIERDVHIIWMFETQNIRIADIYSSVNSIPNHVNTEIFRDRLNVDFTTGSLTIRNIRTTDSGKYNLDIVDPNDTSGPTGRVTQTTFTVIVDYLPIPIIRNTNCSLSSEGTFTSKCVLLCSVLNVSDVTLSWYKGKRLLSSISAFDFSASLSMPLEVEYQDKNTYSCVLNNRFSNQATHLSNTEIRPGSTPPYYLLALIPVFLVVAIIIYWIYRKQKQGGGCCSSKPKCCNMMRGSRNPLVPC